MPLFLFVNMLLLTDKVRQTNLNSYSYSKHLSSMKDYVLLLYIHVICTEGVNQDTVCQTLSCSMRHAFHYS